jgi:hypothetical protein
MVMIILLMTCAQFPTLLICTEHAMLSSMNTPPDNYLILECGNT